MANNAIAIARQQELFVVPEVTKGTLVFPGVTDLVVAAGFGSINQQPTFTNSEEIINSRDVLDRFADRTPAGEWNFPTYVRPSGSAGTAPQEGTLLEAHCGLETVVGATSVTYTPALLKPSVSIWLRKGHTVFFARGATVASATIGILTTGGATWNWNGQFMEMGWAGTGTIDGLHAALATAITVTDGKKFIEGAYVEYEESGTVYNNSDSGYEVTDVTGDVVTITPGLEVELDDLSTIRGFLPDGTQTGSPLASRLGKANIDATDVDVKELEFTFDDAPEYLADEITTSDFPEEYAEIQRNINGKLSVYFREDDLAYFKDGYSSTQSVIKMIVGTVAGSIMTITASQGQLDVPAVTDTDPTVSLDMTFVALGLNGEDSFSIAYT